MAEAEGRGRRSKMTRGSSRKLLAQNLPLGVGNSGGEDDIEARPGNSANKGKERNADRGKSVKARAVDADEDSRTQLARESSRKMLAQKLAMRNSQMPQQNDGDEDENESRRSQRMRKADSMRGSSRKLLSHADTVGSSDALSAASTEDEKLPRVGGADSFSRKQRAEREWNAPSALVKVTLDAEGNYNRATVHQQQLPDLAALERGEIDQPHQCKVYVPTSLFNSNCALCGAKKWDPCHTEEFNCIYCYQTFTALSNHSKPCKVHCGEIKMISSPSKSARNVLPTFTWTCCPDKKAQCHNAAVFREMQIPHSGYHKFKVWSEGSDFNN